MHPLLRPSYLGGGLVWMTRRKLAHKPLADNLLSTWEETNNFPKKGKFTKIPVQGMYTLLHSTLSVS